MEPLRPPIGAAVVVLLVVFAGCSLPVIDGEPAGTGTSPTATPPPSAGTDEGTATGETPAAGTDARTASPLASSTATPTPEPTPTVESETGIRVVEINADVEAVGDEYVVLKNTGETRLHMSGWRVKDGDGHVYTFPDGYTLDIDETVTLHSGRGTQTHSDRFWWSDGQVWDAGGDTVSIFDDRGHRVYQRSYS